MSSVTFAKLEAETEVGLVRAEPRHRLLPGQPPERPPRRLAPERLERRHHRALERVEDLVTRRKRHLDVQLAELELPVGPQVLVAEADRHLVVPAEARDHQDLLEDLRRLGQREERPGLEPHGDEEVSGALGGGLREVRRPDVDEALLVHEAPHRRYDSCREPQVALHPLASQVEVAVAEADALVDVLLVDLERERLGARDDLELVDLQLDLAGRQVRVDRVGRTRGDLALGPDHELVPDLVRDLGGPGRSVRVDHQLCQTRLVAEVDEDQAAVVTPPGGPAREREALPDVLSAQLPAPRSRHLTVSPPTPTVSTGHFRRLCGQSPHSLKETPQASSHLRASLRARPSGPPRPACPHDGSSSAPDPSGRPHARRAGARE